jgi:hypothetical protein
MTSGGANTGAEGALTAIPPSFLARKRVLKSSVFQCTLRLPPPTMALRTDHCVSYITLTVVGGLSAGSKLHSLVSQTVRLERRLPTCTRTWTGDSTLTRLSTRTISHSHGHWPVPRVWLDNSPQPDGPSQCGTWSLGRSVTSTFLVPVRPPPPPRLSLCEVALPPCGHTLSHP